MDSSDFIIATCRKILAPHAEFAFLYGSAANGNLRKESDVDCAAYFKNGISKDAFIKLLFSLEDSLQRDVDLINLNSADIIITMQALANGKLIIDNNHSRFVVFKAQKLSEYIDFKQSRKIIEDNLLRGRLYA